jgi:hypothetical protein
MYQSSTTLQAGHLSCQCSPVNNHGVFSGLCLWVQVVLVHQRTEDSVREEMAAIRWVGVMYDV